MVLLSQRDFLVLLIFGPLLLSGLPFSNDLCLEFAPFLIERLLLRFDLAVQPGSVFCVVCPEAGRLLLALLADFFQRRSRISSQLFGGRLEFGSNFVLFRQPLRRPTAKNCELLAEQIPVIERASGLLGPRTGILFGNGFGSNSRAVRTGHIAGCELAGSVLRQIRTRD